jgi:hypothetical protein
MHVVTVGEAENAERPDSLLSDLSRSQPAKLRDTISSLLQELEERRDEGVDFADVRQRLGWS